MVYEIRESSFQDESTAVVATIRDLAVGRIVFYFPCRSVGKPIAHAKDSVWILSCNLLMLSAA
ncbi:hypothetical protein DF045_10265 [Burkholderia cepacia]|nr:hypothetical protein DF045_10265 [Burkholderia cepacia]